MADLTVRVPAIASTSMVMTVNRNVTAKMAGTEVVSDSPPLPAYVVSRPLCRLMRVSLHNFVERLFQDPKPALQLFIGDNQGHQEADNVVVSTA